MTLALAMPPPAASAPAPGVLEFERLASVGASTPGKATASVSASTPGKATPADGQCFDAWPRRHRKRKEAIAAIKRSQEYKDLCKCSQEYQDSWQLDEPDPTDRSGVLAFRPQARCGDFSCGVKRKACRQAWHGMPWHAWRGVAWHGAGRQAGWPAGRQTELAWPACLPASHSFAHVPSGSRACFLSQAARPPPATGDTMPPKRNRRREEPPALEGGYCSASIPDARELERRANASTFGTPAGFTIDVAVLNIGMPTANHFSAQPSMRIKASGGHDTPTIRRSRKTPAPPARIFPIFKIPISQESCASTPAPHAPDLSFFIFKTPRALSCASTPAPHAPHAHARACPPGRAST